MGGPSLMQKSDARKGNVTDLKLTKAEERQVLQEYTKLNIL